VGAEGPEPLDLSATRVWAAGECLKKAGLPLAETLAYGSRTDDGWIVLNTPDARVATLVTHIGAVEAPVAIALLAGVT
jgi:enediyne polyketide synthase